MRLFGLCVLALSALACGAEPPPPAAAPPPPPPARAARRGVSVQAEIGALSEEKTQKAFEHATRGLMACFTAGTARVPYLAGDIGFYVRIGSEGGTDAAYVTDSTLGDRETEDCMLRVLGRVTWPKPVGGPVAEARNTFHFDPGGDESPPAAVSEHQLGAPFRKAKPALAQCRRRAGAGPMKATLYVDAEGAPAAIGVSTSDTKGESAVPCVLETLRALKFPAPGSHACKVSFVIN